MSETNVEDYMENVYIIFSNFPKMSIIDANLKCGGCWSLVSPQAETIIYIWCQSNDVDIVSLEQSSQLIWRSVIYGNIQNRVVQLCDAPSCKNLFWFKRTPHPPKEHLFLNVYGDESYW